MIHYVMMIQNMKMGSEVALKNESVPDLVYDFFSIFNFSHF